MKTSQLDNGQLQVKTSPRGVVHLYRETKWLKFSDLNRVDSSSLRPVIRILDGT